MISASKASHAVGAQAIEILDAARSQGVRAVESVLDQIGLERRRSALRPVWFVIAGAVVAGAVVLILAPTSGKELRAKIVDLLRSAKNKVRANTVVQKPTALEQRVDAVVGGSSGSVVGVNRPHRAGDQH